MDSEKKPLKCLDCIEHGPPFDGPCDVCGWWTDWSKADGFKGRKHDGSTFATLQSPSPGGYNDKS